MENFLQSSQVSMSSAHDHSISHSHELYDQYVESVIPLNFQGEKMNSRKQHLLDF